MPKIEFETEEEFSIWIKEICKKRKYSLYAVTEESMLVAIPLVSTDPVNYGILKYKQLTNLSKFAEQLSTLLTLPLFKVKSLEFADFRTK